MKTRQIHIYETGNGGGQDSRSCARNLAPRRVHIQHEVCQPNTPGRSLSFIERGGGGERSNVGRGWVAEGAQKEEKVHKLNAI